MIRGDTRTSFDARARVVRVVVSTATMRRRVPPTGRKRGYGDRGDQTGQGALILPQFTTLGRYPCITYAKTHVVWETS